ncbi:MAG: flagellar assembly protein FliW [Deltaproteobacteria bacterium]|nr:flagellar assembly protein FliW [Deltaproteobacteria bacterium]
MSEDSKTEETITFQSSRFGEFSVPKSTLITFPEGIIGFPTDPDFVLLEHKPPFSWLHSVTNPDLAFVVVDGAEFGDNYRIPLPVGDSTTEYKENDEFAVLVIVTVRPDPSMTTANLKAPLFVNLKNRKGIQMVIDDASYSTRFPLWSEKNESKQTSTEEKESK